MFRKLTVLIAVALTLGTGSAFASTPNSSTQDVAAHAGVGAPKALGEKTTSAPLGGHVVETVYEVVEAVPGRPNTKKITRYTVNESRQGGVPSSVTGK